MCMCYGSKFLLTHMCPFWKFSPAGHSYKLFMGLNVMTHVFDIYLVRGLAENFRVNRQITEYTATTFPSG